MKKISLNRHEIHEISNAIEFFLYSNHNQITAILRGHIGDIRFLFGHNRHGDGKLTKLIDKFISDNYEITGEK